MTEKTIKSRIIHKHDIEANWLKANNFIPQQGELIVYDIDENYDYERFKIGDGETLVNTLPFTNDVIVNDTIDGICELSDELLNAGYQDYVADAVSVHNNANDSHDDIRETISNLTARLENNSGVRAITTGTTNGTISVNTNGTSAEVAVKGLGTAAYTSSSSYAPASHSQAASTVTAGTFAGQVVANASSQAPATSLLRNSKIVSTTTNPTKNGEIVWTYG
jgi:hypothetical protein